ncbi:hypothetical protein TB2_021729 [Malus domestica]
MACGPEPFTNSFTLGNVSSFFFQNRPQLLNGSIRRRVLVAVLFQVSTVSSEARPASVMRFFVFGTYTDCPVFEVNEERKEGE